ncbi:hypothetical protein AciX8_1475 [Granulicella mallensis MP5ACTX8]|uniref:Glycosyltransferase RgtA/B/C/D-like domain-containing protein n=2 Tax=Granulicella mallensis TaxID=940614 RepID=G8P0X0_GRAMM|nr:hypothetical protein AciX8_1475 [Granulicella mallensis MP5ACTX8]
MRKREMQMTSDTISRPSTAGNSSSPARSWFGCSAPALLLYVIFCLALAVADYLRPLPTFDRYLYAGAVASLRYSDPATIQRIARTEFDAQPDPFQFENVSAEPYFTDVYNNPDHFMQQLGFYRVKLGYVATGYALWRAGLPILTGLRLLSACCLLITGLAVLAWTHETVLSALLLLAPSVLTMGRMVTVDPLSTTIVLLALLAFAKNKDLLAAELLTASVLLRFDNAILVLILLAWMIWKKRLSLSLGALFGALSAGCVVLTNHFSSYYGWRVLMQHSFIKPEMEPVKHPIPISFAGYLHAIAALRVIPYTYMTIWLLVAAAAWRKLPPKSALRTLLPLAGLCTLARLAIYPNVEDRYFLWAYLLAGIALIQVAHAPSSTTEKDALC